MDEVQRQCIELIAPGLDSETVIEAFDDIAETAQEFADTFERDAPGIIDESNQPLT